MDELDLALKVLAGADQREVLRRGWHLQKRHYYSALNDVEWLEANQDLWRGACVPRDIEWDVEGQMGVAREVGGFVEELRDVPDKESVGATGVGGEHGCPERQPCHPAVFHWHNAFFNTADALVWYGLVRSRKPRRVVEVGCGWSSLLLKRAIEKNAEEAKSPSPCPLPVQSHGERGEPNPSPWPATPCVLPVVQSHDGERGGTVVTQIEPYPNERVFAALPKQWAHHRTPVQRVPPRVFDELGAGDVLFYDGSHCARVASDVNWMVFRVLPRLRAGVLIHFHDVFWPREYPVSWIVERRQTWNEQYVLQALLMNSKAYRVVIANGFLSEVRGDEVTALYRGVQKAWGASVWIEKVEEPRRELEEEARRLEGLCVVVPKAHRDAKPAG